MSHSHPTLVTRYLIQVLTISPMYMVWMPNPLLVYLLDLRCEEGSVERRFIDDATFDGERLASSNIGLPSSVNEGVSPALLILSLSSRPECDPIYCKAEHFSSGKPVTVKYSLRSMKLWV